ncbi:FeoB-associated Cys-rich membrane protein [Anaerotignum lactatifermentans]|uniref:FeoB-associated Cys-rich membrane protein n=1 Tax=Anaerotignum lactatifermentans TaxID=160404 RepID=A0ABS2G8Y2_9FIRM|nr:FeoB-associated Cys-rich membrane protein [Anaerotignum lactatifermentans]MBM6829759.1 FeoB-associated Cys-rich membrane protein [Anaerotignum lactatifermentans]MBM6877180.1 FeoB-associated Cys-rich membrane protein [Anaerotignum lactatifermentans]MBM6951418.1 FeoB-associated Cys-rich membrane protein [Anaerotignum lactatifermentans]
MESIIVAMIVLAILGAACIYIYKAKKNGAKCIGCPAGGSCASQKGSCSCGCHGEKKSQ